MRVLVVALFLGSLVASCSSGPSEQEQAAIEQLEELDRLVTELQRFEDAEEIQTWTLTECVDRASGSGPSVGRRYRYSGSAEEVLVHYNDQLIDRGWELARDEETVRWFELSETDLVSSIAVSAPDDGVYTVTGRVDFAFCD